MLGARNVKNEEKRTVYKKQAIIYQEFIKQDQHNQEDNQPDNR